MSNRKTNNNNIDRGKTATIKKGKKYEVNNDKTKALSNTNNTKRNSDKKDLKLTEKDRTKSDIEDLFRKLKEDRENKGRKLHPTDQIQDTPKEKKINNSDELSAGENLFLKMKKDRQKKGIPLFPEKEEENAGLPNSSSDVNNDAVKPNKRRESTPRHGSRQNSDSFSRGVNVSIPSPINSSREESASRNTRNDSFNHSQGVREVQSSPARSISKQGHMPDKTTDERESPNTPSSLCISPWVESSYDTNDEDENEDGDLEKEENTNNKKREGKPNKNKSNKGLTQSSTNLLPGEEDKSNPTEDLDERWSDDKTLAECNMYMLTNGINTDVTIMVGTDKQEVIKAHYFILSNRSPELCKLLQSDEYVGSQVLVITGISVDTFKCILRYIYTDDAEFNTEQALAIIPATGIVGPRALREKCLRYLLGEMSSEIACILLEYAYVYEHSYVYEKCLNFILVNALDVFKEEKFRDLSRQCVDDVTKSDDLNADEYSVFEGLIQWAEKECVRQQLFPTNENIREILDIMIYNVRFVTLEPDEFNARISQRNILKPEEVMEIFQIMHGKAGDIPDYINFEPRRQYNIKYHLQKEMNGDNRFEGDSDLDKESAVKSKRIVSDVDLPIRRVVRFQKFGDTWKMDGVDSIAFRVSVPIVFRGVQIFGPENETECYHVHIKLYDDIDNEVRSDRVMIEPSPDTIIHDVILEEPARIPADRFFTVTLIIHSEPTVEGAEGVRVLNSSGVIFEFKSVENSSPNTTVTNGQIPSILYSKTNG